LCRLGSESVFQLVLRITSVRKAVVRMAGAAAGVVLLCAAIWVLDHRLFTTVEDYESVEIRFARPLCKEHQRVVYSALCCYRREKGDLPRDLQILVREGYVEHDFLYCPKRSVVATMYEYYPNHFGDANSVLLSESIEPHGRGDPRLKRVNPVAVYTMGDGTIIEENVGEEN
jgi:hypothetical protein